MTTLKIKPFLMCPAHAASTLGGTPQAQSLTGGHIKNGSGWVTAHAAALDGLHGLLAKDRGNERDGRDEQGNDDKPEVDVRHGSGFLRIEAEKPLAATGFGFELARGEALNLKLTLVRRKVRPASYGRLGDPQCLSCLLLGLVMLDDRFGTHAPFYRQANICRKS
jgi:hypothetical protein